jgi:hypothetical protein
LVPHADAGANKKDAQQLVTRPRSGGSLERKGS